VPKDWKRIPSDKGTGYKYGNPGREKYDDVRVQKGNPNSSNSAQRKDYIKWKKDGKYLDKNGNEVSGNSPEAHIPIEEFKFNGDIFK
jgi:hypothetical protein